MGKPIAPARSLGYHPGAMPEESPNIGDFGATRGNGGGGVTVLPRIPPPPKSKPAPGEETELQGDRVMYWGGSASWNSSDPSNPCAFEGWGEGLYYGTYQTYRFMRRHPKIAHVRRQVVAAILANAWGWTELEGAPAGALDLIQKMFTAEYRLRVWSHAVTALDYGNAKFEKVWEYKEGRWWLRLKPLAVDRNEILADPNGNFVGFEMDRAGYVIGADGVARYRSNKFLDKRKSFLVTYEGEAGDLHGSSRMENLRPYCWRDWLDTAQQLQWITQKIAGKLCIITTPSGSYTTGQIGADNKPIRKSYKEAAQAAGRAITDPRSNGVVWFPTAALPDNIRKENVDLIKAPMVQIQVVDFGSHAPAITGCLARLQWNEGLMSEGYLRSARTNSESKNGSRADSEQHTENDIVDMELIDQALTMSHNEDVVDDVLEVNYGPKARGTIRATAARMQDEHAEMDGKLIDALLEDQELRPQFLAGPNGADMDAVVERRSIPKKTKSIVLKDVALTTPGDQLGPTGGVSGPNAPKAPEPKPPKSPRTNPPKPPKKPGAAGGGNNGGR